MEAMEKAGKKIDEVMTKIADKTKEGVSKASSKMHQAGTKPTTRCSAKRPNSFWKR